MELEFFSNFFDLKFILCFLATISGVFVITTKNPIISVFNLIVLYILVAFYLIYIGITYIGISYIVVYIGAIAILFLFVIMMIDIEVVDRKNNNYLPLLFFLLGVFLYTLRDILYNLGNLKINNILQLEDDKYIINFRQDTLFNSEYIINTNYFKNWNNLDFSSKFIEKSNIIFNNLKIGFNNFDNNNIINIPLLTKKDIKDNYYIMKDLDISTDLDINNYLIITPDWNSAASRVTQISAIGDVLYTIYYSFIYIVSIILLLAMLGAIILTAEQKLQVRNITIVTNDNKTSNIIGPIIILITCLYNYFKINKFTLIKKKNSSNYIHYSLFGFFPFSDIVNNVQNQTEIVIGNLIYFFFFCFIIGLLLLLINSSLSLSIKYIEKGGGFECGFTSFLQTREIYNILFYRVSLLFLVFDLEIILIFPFTAIYEKNISISKNNVLIFLYILVIGFIFELKEGALNIVKPAHSTVIKVDY